MSIEIKCLVVLFSILAHSAYGNPRVRRQDASLDDLERAIAEEMLEVKNALEMAIKTTVWPTLSQEQSEENEFTYTITNLTIDPFYVSSAKFKAADEAEPLEIQITQAYGQANAEYYVSKEYKVLWWSFKPSSKGNVNIKFDGADMTASLNITGDKIELSECDSSIDSLEIKVSGGEDGWEKFLHGLINAITWLFEGSITDFLNEQFCHAFSVVLTDYAEVFLELAQNILFFSLGD